MSGAAPEDRAEFLRLLGDYARTGLVHSGFHVYCSGTLARDLQQKESVGGTCFSCPCSPEEGLPLGKLALREDCARIAISAFFTNIFLLAVLIIANPARNRFRRTIVWKLIRWGVVMLLGIIEAYLIKLFEMYTYWGKIVYAEESLAFFEAPLGRGLQKLQ